MMRAAGGSSKQEPQAATKLPWLPGSSLSQQDPARPVATRAQDPHKHVHAHFMNTSITHACTPPTPRRPAGVVVSLDPRCDANPAGGPPLARLACTATFPSLPSGYSLPNGGAALKLAAGGAAPWRKELAPCQQAGYKAFTQSAAFDKNGAVTFTTACYA